MFLKVARYEDQGDRLLDRSGHVHFEYEEAGAGARPEVDRTALRGLLLDALPPSCVRWDSVVREVSPAEEGNWNVVIDGHSEGPFDLIVVASGRLSSLLASGLPTATRLPFRRSQSRKDRP